MARLTYKRPDIYPTNKTHWRRATEGGRGCDKARMHMQGKPKLTETTRLRKRRVRNTVWAACVFARNESAVVRPTHNNEYILYYIYTCTSLGNSERTTSRITSPSLPRVYSHQVSPFLTQYISTKNAVVLIEIGNSIVIGENLLDSTAIPLKLIHYMFRWLEYQF